MDFGTLLNVAQKNENTKQSGACYQTKFAPPKKPPKQAKTLSDNIKKFLARKEDEERRKSLEEKKKRENLLALRDHKAQSRINKHLKVCKAANKSVLIDAIDNDNTAVTMAGYHPSPRQPGDWDWLALTAPAQRKQPDRVSFPRPPKAPDGSLLYERVPNKSEVDRLTVTPPQPQPSMQAQQTIMKRTRPPFDEINGSDGIALSAGLPGGPPAKRAHHSQQLHPKHSLEHTAPSVLPLAPPLNGRAAHPHTLPHGPPLSRSNARKQVISWMDAPDDVYFRASDQTKRLRRTLSSVELRRAARKPWRRLPAPFHPPHPQRAVRGDDMVVILD